MAAKSNQRSPAEKKRKFLKGFRVYLVMSVFFVLLNVLGGSDNFWAIWPILGWGIGVAIQGMSLYGPLRDRENDTYSDYEDDEVFDLNQNRPDRRPPERTSKPESRGFREEDLI